MANKSGEQPDLHPTVDLPRRSNPLTISTISVHHCTPAVRLEMLAKVPLFADLSATELKEVDRRCTAEGFTSGDAIYQEGQAANRFYVVASGAAKVLKLSPDGRQTMLDLCGPGDFLGSVPALGEETYSDSAWALTPSCILGLGTQDFTEIIEQFPAVALATLRGVSRRLSDSQRAVHMLTGAPLEQRLAATLLLLAEKVGRPWQNMTLLDVPLTREDTASMSGAATESVSRILSDWKRQNLIDSGRRWIAIRDVAALEQKL